MWVWVKAGRRIIISNETFPPALPVHKSYTTDVNITTEGKHDDDDDDAADDADDDNDADDADDAYDDMFQSPGYPANYPNLQECTYNFEPAAGAQLKFSCSDMDLAATSAVGALCTGDFLR